MSHTTTWEKHGIYWQFYGIVDAKEYLATDAELYNDPRSDHIKYWIWDGTDIEELAISDMHAELIASADWAATEHNKNVKGAIIATDPGIKNLMEVYIETSMEFESSWQVKIFDNIKDARQWVSC